MRHFKGFASAGASLKLRRVIHNFIKTHQAINRTPAEATGIELGPARDRLLDLMRVCLVSP
ncbi:MAG: hypothetical protein QMC89_03080 [Candidatus Hodarchaeaceae archaeon]|nr:hypothetical protein [Candidatus Hodarchaeaceae archaeon]